MIEDWLIKKIIEINAGNGRNIILLIIANYRVLQIVVSYVHERIILQEWNERMSGIFRFFFAQ